MYAAEAGHADVVDVLLGRGANVDAVGDGGSTASSWAESFDRVDVLDVISMHKREKDFTRKYFLLRSPS